MKFNNDIEDPEDDFSGSLMIEDFDLDDLDGTGGCEVFDAVMSAIFISRPLGILWDDDLIEKFLKNKGYDIIERVDEAGETYRVPVKSDSKIIPDQKNSLRKVFDREVQKTLLKWLSKIE